MVQVFSDPFLPWYLARCALISENEKFFIVQPLLLWMSADCGHSMTVNFRSYGFQWTNHHYLLLMDFCYCQYRLRNGLFLLLAKLLKQGFCFVWNWSPVDIQELKSNIAHAFNPLKENDDSMAASCLWKCQWTALSNWVKWQMVTFTKQATIDNDRTFLQLMTTYSTRSDQIPSIRYCSTVISNHKYPNSAMQ